jgi:hypothetical protein
VHPWVTWVVEVGMGKECQKFATAAAEGALDD